MTEEMRKDFKCVSAQIAGDDESSLTYTLFWLKNHFIENDEVSNLFDVLYHKCSRLEDVDYD